MLKQEFLDSLRRSLSGNLEHNRVEEHLRYYSDYIESRIRQGDIEEEIMRDLGEPRLIAKTLLGFGNTYTSKEEYVEEEQKQEKKVHHYQFNGKHVTVPAWISTVAVSLVMILLLGIFFALFAGLLHFAFPILVLFFMFRYLLKFFR